MPQLILGIDETVGEDGILLSALKLSSRMPSPLNSIMAPSFRALDVEAKRLGCDYIVTGAGGDELLTVAPVLAADLLRSGDVHGLYRLACATRRSFSMGWPTIARQLLWSRGLRPLLGDVFRRRFPGWMARRHDRWVDENTPDWVAPDPMLRQAVIARGRASDDAPLTEPFYVHDYTRGIDRASIANEMDEFAADGRLNDVKIVSPFFDKDLFDFASRVPPDLLYRGGMSKSLIREVLAKRYPALHFERQKKVFAFKYLRQQLVKEGPLAWRAMNGPMLLAELGIIRRSAVNEMMGRIFAKGSWVDADRAWEILNLEAWVRGREGRPTIEKG
jgi:asparagine synthetase B (glutamine-hydrolysing)